MSRGAGTRIGPDMVTFVSDSGEGMILGNVMEPFDSTTSIIDSSADFSFPSDHATAAFAIAAAFHLRGLFGRGVLFLLGAAALSVSHVYVGIH